jgi:GT2 family glycosyltransferase
MTPSVYLLILTWNAKPTVLECLESVLKTEYENFRIVVIDNGSVDGTAEELKAQFGKKIDIIENGSNLRFSRGNNAGIEFALKAGADYIMLLNDDIMIDPHMVKELVAVAESNSRIGAVGPKMYYYNLPNQLWFAGGVVSLVRGVCSHRGIREFDHGQFDQVSECDYITGCGLMMRRAAVEKVGMLDPAYSAYYEDTDWCWRAKLAGYRMVYVPRAKLWHKISASTGGQLTRYKIKHKLISGWIFFSRYAKPYHWLTIPIFFTLDTLRILGLIISGKIRPQV